MEVAKAMQRLEMNVSQPDIFACISEKVDQLLLQAVCNLEEVTHGTVVIRKSSSCRRGNLPTKDGTSPQQFVGANADCVFLVLPKKECEELCRLPATCTLSEHKSIVAACWSYSDVGKALFSDVMTHISAEELASTIGERLKELSCRTEPVTEAYLVEFMGDLHAEITGIQGVECLSGKRNIHLLYRGSKVQITVNSILDEATVR
eukprot:610931-Amphidinium_carterae.2